MRDLSRFLNLYQSFTERDNAPPDSALIQAFRICYLSRLSLAKHDDAFRLLLSSSLLQLEHTDLKLQSQTQMLRIDYHTQALAFSNAVKPSVLHARSFLKSQLRMGEVSSLKGPHANELQYLVDCLNCNLPLLVVTNDTQRFVANLQTLAHISGQ